jgi:hypothetical protein
MEDKKTLENETENREINFYVGDRPIVLHYECDKISKNKLEVKIYQNKSIIRFNINKIKKENKTFYCEYCYNPINGEGFKDPDSKSVYCNNLHYKADKKEEN